MNELNEPSETISDGSSCRKESPVDEVDISYTPSPGPERLANWEHQSVDPVNHKTLLRSPRDACSVVLNTQPSRGYREQVSLEINHRSPVCSSPLLCQPDAVQSSDVHRSTSSVNLRITPVESYNNQVESDILQVAMQLSPVGHSFPSSSSDSSILNHDEFRSGLSRYDESAKFEDCTTFSLFDLDDNDFRQSNSIDFHTSSEQHMVLCSSPQQSQGSQGLRMNYRSSALPSECICASHESRSWSVAAPVRDDGLLYNDSLQHDQFKNHRRRCIQEQCTRFQQPLQDHNQQGYDQTHQDWVEQKHPAKYNEHTWKDQTLQQGGKLTFNMPLGSVSEPTQRMREITNVEVNLYKENTVAPSDELSTSATASHSFISEACLQLHQRYESNAAAYSRSPRASENEAFGREKIERCLEINENEETCRIEDPSLCISNSISESQQRQEISMRSVETKRSKKFTKLGDANSFDQNEKNQGNPELQNIEFDVQAGSTETTVVSDRPVENPLGVIYFTYPARPIILEKVLTIASNSVMSEELDCTKPPYFPLNRCKKIMQLTSSGQRRTHDAVLVIDKACAMFVTHLTTLTREFFGKSTACTIQEKNIREAARASPQMDFLIHILARQSSGSADPAT